MNTLHHNFIPRSQVYCSNSVTDKMKFDDAAPGQFIDDPRVRNVYRPSTAPDRRIHFITYLIFFLFIIFIVYELFNIGVGWNKESKLSDHLKNLSDEMDTMRKKFGEVLADLDRKQISDIQNQAEKIRGRLDQEVSQLTKNTSLSIETTARNASLEFADVQKKIEGMNKTLERTSAELDKMVSNEEKKIESLSKRIVEEEAMSDALVRYAVANEGTKLLPRGTGQKEWRIENYTSRVYDELTANAKQNVSIEGPSFYTKGIGYNLFIAYLATTSHHSIHLFAQAGAYDRFLKWPMYGNITVTIGGPSSAMNTRKNIPCECLSKRGHPDLQGYDKEMRNDSRCHVDFQKNNSELKQSLENDSLRVQVEADVQIQNN